MSATDQSSKPKGHAMRLRRTWVLLVGLLLIAGLSSCGQQAGKEVDTKAIAAIRGLGGSVGFDENNSVVEVRFNGHRSKLTDAGLVLKQAKPVRLILFYRAWISGRRLSGGIWGSRFGGSGFGFDHVSGFLHVLRLRAAAGRSIRTPVSWCGRQPCNASLNRKNTLRYGL